MPKKWPIEDRLEEMVEHRRALLAEGRHVSPASRRLNPKSPAARQAAALQRSLKRHERRDLEQQVGILGGWLARIRDGGDTVPIGEALELVMVEARLTHELAARLLAADVEDAATFRKNYLRLVEGHQRERVDPAVVTGIVQRIHHQYPAVPTMQVYERAAVEVRRRLGLDRFSARQVRRIAPLRPRG